MFNEEGNKLRGKDALPSWSCCIDTARIAARTPDAARTLHTHCTHTTQHAHSTSHSTPHSTEHRTTHSTARTLHTASTQHSTHAHCTARTQHAHNTAHRTARILHTTHTYTAHAIIHELVCNSNYGTTFLLPRE